MTTDSFVVKPMRFPGGSIGELAVNGTVNDLAMAGARPLALTLSLILEEGLAADDLAPRSRRSPPPRDAAGVEIVAGDTKVVERGHADGMYVCTTGVGRRDPRARALAAARCAPATACSSPARSASTAPRSCSRAASSSSTPRSSPTRARCGPPSTRCSTPPGPSLRCLRDATRGGVASVLNELARASGVAMLVREAEVPVHPAVAGASEILGIDPMYVANEGKLVAFVAPEQADAALAALRAVAGRRAGGGDRRGQDRAARDGPGRDRFRRQAGDGPTGGRSAAADLLRTEERTAWPQWSSYRGRTRRRRSPPM